MAQQHHTATGTTPTTSPISIDRVAVIGTGVIGTSWSALFLAGGLHVTAADPAAGAEERLRRSVTTQWQTLRELHHTPLDAAEALTRLHFVDTPEAAVQDADFVQENGPERGDFKRDLFARLDAAARPGVVLATSSSGLPVSRIASATQHPERVLVGHPFNPPHLIPLVEVVGGEQTSPASIEAAMTFYRALGKRPLHVRSERLGYVANRLQAALWREAFALVASGHASVQDIDAAVSQGPGLRWALTGPFLNMHLSGGEGGIAHVLDHLGPPMEVWWDDLGHTRLSPDLNARIVQGVNAELAGRTTADVTAQRDAALLRLLRLKTQFPEL